MITTVCFKCCANIVQISPTLHKSIPGPTLNKKTRLYGTVGNKTTNGTEVSQVSKVLDQNLAPLSRKCPELIPEESLTNVHPFVKNVLTGKIPNLQWAGRLAHFSKNCKKLTQGQEILSVVKGYVIPFLKIPVQRTIPKQMVTSKIQELFIDQEIMEMLDKVAIKKWSIGIFCW